MATYLVNQNFEGTGFDNSETWINYGGSTGAANPDYTTGALLGTQSLRMKDDSSEGTYAITKFSSDTGINTFWGFFRLKVVDRPSSTVELMQTYNAQGPITEPTGIEVHEMLYISSGGVLSIVSPRSGSWAAGSNALALDTVYYVWVYINRGTTYSDGWVKISTTPVEPGTNEIAWSLKSHGDSYRGTNCVGFTTLHSVGYEYLVDQVLVDDEAIGDDFLDSTDDLTASGVTTGAPSLDTPALNASTYDLTASGLTTGTPTVGTPVLTVPQYARPDSDITTTGRGGGTYASIDEVTASDTDFVYGNENVAVTYVVGLSNVTDPGAHTGHTFRYRIAKLNGTTVDTGGNAVYCTVTLLQGGTTIKADSQKTAAGWTTYSLTLSESEASAITDYTDLRLQFYSPASGGSTSSRRAIGISWAELEVPGVSGSTDNLTASGVTTGAPGLDTPALGQAHDLTASGVTTGAPGLDTPALGQAHDLTASGVTTGAPGLDTPALGSAGAHDLTASNLEAGQPALGSPALGQVHGLSAAGVTAGAPVLAVPAVGQVHGLAAAGLWTGSPELAAPGVSQAHALSACGLVTGLPSLGTPALGQAGVMSAEPLVTGSPSLGTPALEQAHSLNSAVWSTGAPVVGSPVLGQAHALSAGGLVTGSPSLGTPALLLSGLNLEAVGIATGAPALGAPALGVIVVLTAVGIVTGQPVVGVARWGTVTPWARRLLVEGEDRALVVEGEARVHLVDGERRTVKV